MIKHLFTLMWNKKKQNFLLMTEIFVSFFVMFAVFTFSVYYYQNYRRDIGFDYEDVWDLGYDIPLGMQDKDSIADFRIALKQVITSQPEVIGATFSSVNIPYGNASIGNGFTHNKIDWGTEGYTVDDNYQKLLNIPLKEGRWFTRADDVFTERPVVINETFKQQVFGDAPAVGKIIGDAKVAGDNMKVIGVAGDIKDKGDYLGPIMAMYKRIDTNYSGGGSILVKVKPGTDAAFEGRLYKLLSNFMKNKSVDIQHMSKQRDTKNSQLLAPVITLLCIAGFLIINVALGLFGVLWYNISKRKAEIGLRRAVGASGAGISYQMVGEALILSTLALIAGCFFTVQFPLLNVFNIATSTYIIAMVITVLFIYLLVLICAFYPGRQAADIYPAVALHED